MVVGRQSQSEAGADVHCCGDGRRKQRPVVAEQASIAAERMVIGDFDQDETQSVGILDPRLDQSPRLLLRCAEDSHARCQQAMVLLAHVADLQPQRRGWAGALGGSAGDFEEAAAEEEHQAGVGRVPELPVDRQAEGVPVEPTAPLGAAGRSKNRLLNTSTSASSATDTAIV